MEGVLQLTDTQFSNTDGQVMRCNIPGIVFVMFKKTNCDWCKAAMLALNRLAKYDLRIKWAVIDVGSYKNVTAMARESSTPIKGVPTFILYVNGRPHINYKGKRTVENIGEFVNKALASIGTTTVTSRFVGEQPQQKFYQPPEQQQQSRFPKSSRGPPQQNTKGGVEGVNIPTKVTPHNAPYLAYSKEEEEMRARGKTKR